jgi:hypothetical protein
MAAAGFAIPPHFLRIKPSDGPSRFERPSPQKADSLRLFDTKIWTGRRRLRPSIDAPGQQQETSTQQVELVTK